MIIINSAAYIISEFKSELGAVPPCFLPLGNIKLIEHQASAIRNLFSDEIFVSLPATYNLADYDKRILNELDLKPIFCPDEFTLAETLIFVINLLPRSPNHLRLLHGDTLIYDMPAILDCISIGDTSSEYDWEIEHNDIQIDKQKSVWAGFFSVSQPREFTKCLTLSRGNFVKAVRSYNTDCKKLEYIATEHWFDLGHVNTYFSSRSQITTQRSFNNIRIEDGVVYKSGLPSKKIEAEENWFENVPFSVKKYTPNLLDGGQLSNGSRFYATEYLTCIPLNELFVHGRNNASFWKNQAILIKKYFLDSRLKNTSTDRMVAIDEDSKLLYESKTIIRLRDFANKTNFDLNKKFHINEKTEISILEITDVCINAALRLSTTHAIMHGDFCFSNILFDSRANSIKVVDPRGITTREEFSIYGDQNYDLAKLMHSAVGLYDFIIAGDYQIIANEFNEECIYFEIDDRIKLCQSIFVDADFIPNLPNSKIMPVVVLLFLSMLPLHSDRPDRQKAMLLNAIRIYKNYIA